MFNDNDLHIFRSKFLQNRIYKVDSKLSLTPNRKFVMLLFYLNAVVANGAVGAPRRPIKLASDAPLHPHRNPIYFYISVKRCPKVIVSVLISICCKIENTFKDFHLVFFRLIYHISQPYNS